MEDRIAEQKRKAHQRYASTSMLTGLQRQRTPVPLHFSPLARGNKPPTVPEEASPGRGPVPQTARIEAPVESPVVVRRRASSLGDRFKHSWDFSEAPLAVKVTQQRPVPSVESSHIPQELVSLSQSLRPADMLTRSQKSTRDLEVEFEEALKRARQAAHDKGEKLEDKPGAYLAESTGPHPHGVVQPPNASSPSTPPSAPDTPQPFHDAPPASSSQPSIVHPPPTLEAERAAVIADAAAKRKSSGLIALIKEGATGKPVSLHALKTEEDADAANIRSMLFADDEEEDEPEPSAPAKSTPIPSLAGTTIHKEVEPEARLSARSKSEEALATDRVDPKRSKEAKKSTPKTAPAEPKKVASSRALEIKQHGTMKRKSVAERFSSIFAVEEEEEIVKLALNVMDEASKPDMKDLVWEPVEGSPGKVALVGAQIPALVEATVIHFTSNDFAESILITHSHFMSSKDMFLLLEKLYKKAKEKKDVRTQLRVVNIVKHWFQYNLEDFHTGSKVNAELESFLKKLQKGSETEVKMGEVLLSAWQDAYRDRKAEEEDKATDALAKAPKALLPRQFLDGVGDAASVSLLDISPLEIARQLTLEMADLLRKVRPRELVKKRYDKPLESPNWAALASRYTKISHWISTEILSNVNVKQRAKVLSFFISVCDKMVTLQNFAGVMAVVSALSHFTIDRLQETWKLLPTKDKDRWVKLQEFATPMGNFRNMRPVAEAAKPPCIPPPGLLVKDLIFIEDGNSHFRDEKKKVLNVEKLFMVSKIVARLRAIQSIYYQLAWVEQIQKYIASAKIMSEAEMEEASKKLERKEI